MSWPRRVFVESTALFQLGPRVENVDFARLLEMRDKLGIELCTTEVNFRVYLRFRKRETSQARSRIARANQELENYSQDYGEFDTILGRFDAFTSTMDKTFEMKFQEMGIHVLPLPRIEVQRLLQMSIDGVPPFEKPRESANERSSEKGFRDALIMFTILEAVRGVPEVNALVVTDDSLLAEGFRIHSEEFKTVVNCVGNISLANKFIQERVSATIREALRAESEEAKAVLLAHRTAIEAKVSEIREIEATDFGLFGIIKDKDGASLSVESVLSVKFEDVEAAIWKNVDKPRSTVLFKMKCEAKVIVSNPCVPQFGFPKYQIGGGTKVYSAFSVSSETQEKIVPLSFYGQATLVRKGTEWVLEELRIDRSMPSLEDYFELAMVRAPTGLDGLKVDR